MRRRFATAVVAALSLLPAAPSAADVTDYLAKPIASVTIQSGGQPVNNPRILGLIETRVGDMLAAAPVRESIVHLFSLGEFDDVRVRAANTGGSVSLVYELTPLRTVQSVAVRTSDRSPVDAGRLRQLIRERFGASPRPARAPEIAALVEDDLRQNGYLHSRVAPVLTSRGDTSVLLTLTVTAGTATRIGTIEVDGDPGMSIPELLRFLQISTGTIFRRENLNARIDRYLDERRSRGYLAARMSFSPQFADDDRIVHLQFSVAAGPHVNVVFTGDPLPENRRDELVPIVREGSADEDLLEDASNRIQEFLQSQGFRDAAAPHAREQRGDELYITFTTSKGPQYRVGRVDFSGNSSITLTDLQQRVRIRPGQPFSQAVIDGDLAVIADLYRRSGFANVQIDASTESEAVQGAAEIPVAIRFAISENARTIVQSVRVEGAQTLNAADLVANLNLQSGQPFSLAALAADRDAIQLQYANRGFPSAVVASNPGLSADDARADVVFSVREGPQVLVDHVLIVGNRRTRTEMIERELLFRAGDPLGLDQVNETQRRLTALGLFRRVGITEVAHGDEGRRDLLVAIDEAPATTVGYGGGIEAGEVLRTEDGVATQTLEVAPRASFEVGRRNLFGKNRSINLFGSASLHLRSANEGATSSANLTEYRLLSTFREPRLFDTTADGLVTAAVEQQIRSSFSFHRVGATAQAVRRLSTALSITGSYQIQRTKLLRISVSQENQGSLQPLIARLFTTDPLLLSSLSSLLIYDRRDDPVNPTTGHYQSVNGQLSTGHYSSFSGDNSSASSAGVRFAKSFFTGQGFRTIVRSRGIVLAGNARLGMAREFGASNPIPEPERFFAGGDTTVRGFALDTLGVRHDPSDPQRDTIDTKGFPIGGNATVILMTEARLPIRRDIGVVAFFDSGNVFQRLSQVNLAEMRGAVGFGVRYTSPFGPIRFDMGFKTDVQSLQCADDSLTARCSESRYALHISFGQAF